MIRFALLFILISSQFELQAQPDRWQQKVNYEMVIDFDAVRHQFTGDQKLTYYNQSPDVLDKVYFHLYYNAFQPGSAMDVRSRSLPDPDARVRDRISKLKEDEIGYHQVISLTQDGKPVQYKTSTNEKGARWAPFSEIFRSKITSWQSSHRNAC